MLAMWLWILAFLLKMSGAAWDTSYHFMHLRDTFALPHTINLIGFALSCGLLIWHSRTQKGLDTRSLRTTWLGLAVFIMAAPLDEAYHRAFGLDLTAWSPTHFMLYIGTFIMIAGIMAAYVKEPARMKGWYSFGLFALLLFLAEDILFPLGQQEYGAITVWLFDQGRPMADAELLSFVKDPYLQAFGGFPLSLYPIYLVYGYALVAGMARRFHPFRFSATVVIGAYLAYRAVAWAIFGATGWPQSFVPYFMLAGALAIDLVGNLVASRRPRILLQAAAITAVAYVGALVWQQIPGMIMPPWPMLSFLGAAAMGVVGLVLAEFAYPIFTGEGLADLPLFKRISGAVAYARAYVLHR